MNGFTLVKKASFRRLICLCSFKAVVSCLAQFWDCVHKCSPRLKKIVTGMLSKQQGGKRWRNRGIALNSFYYVLDSQRAIACLCRTCVANIVHGTAAGVNTDTSDGLLLIQCPFLHVKHTSLPDLSPPSSCAPRILFICFARKQPQHDR